MKRSATTTYLTFLVIAAAIVSAALPAEAASRDFIGRWVNADRDTRNLTRLVITRRGRGPLALRAFGQCHPQDCDWGRTRLSLYAPSVDVPLQRGARRGTALFRESFKRTTLTLTLINARTMRFCTYTNFTDNSGRSDYYNCGTLKKRGRVRRGRVRRR